MPSGLGSVRLLRASVLSQTSKNDNRVHVYPKIAAVLTWRWSLTETLGLLD